jgi:hypothetical protein
MKSNLQKRRALNIFSESIVSSVLEEAVLDFQSTEKK